MLELYGLQTEYRENPLGIDVKNPGFSWKLRSTERDTMQVWYRVAVSSGGNLVWDSGRIQSDQSLYVIYEGEELAPASRYDVSVEAADNHGQTARADGWFETGLMTYENFQADWITHAFADELEECAVFVRSFSVKKRPVKARIYVSALGLYELEWNGKRVGDARFTPGWTSYQKRLQYQTYDVTELLAEENHLRITVGNGWYKGILGFYGQGCHYGKRTALIAQIELTGEDGTVERIVTDEAWGCTTAEHRYHDIYNGEIIDFTYVEKGPVPARRYPYPKDILVAQENEPVRITERVEAKALIRTPRGETVIDFGQNLAGVVEARIRCDRGTRVTIRHAEALDGNGNFYTTNLRTAKATDVFVCSGGEDVFLPAFTYHGFRYIQIEGLDDPQPGDFTACVMHTDLRRTAAFSCSDEDVNQLWRNIDWTVRSNFFDIPTDCPQRDERLGYTGDTEIFAPTAVRFRDVALFFRKWLRDLRTEQSDEFGVPLTAPDILRTHACVSIWHDAAAIVPWIVWQAYGDVRVLEEQYESMKSSVEYTRRLAGDAALLLRENSSQFGDWVALDAPKGPYRRQAEGILYPSMDEKAGGTDSWLIGNAYYLYSIDIVAKAAAILGRDQDAAEYRKLYETVLEAFRREYVTAAGRLVTETQTACALALYFRLVEEKDRARVLDQLAYQLVKTKKHLRTGFVGTQYIMHALSQNGRHALAGDILLKEDCPSWLYSVKLGATTVWELWDGVNPDGSFNLFEMNSLNQFGFATVGDWICQELGGLQLLEPGYKKSRIAPGLIRGITSVDTSVETPYGRLSCALTCENGRILADIHVPENTTAEICLPERKTVTAGSGDYHFEYETELCYEAQPYSEDSTLNGLLAHASAQELFMREAPELAQSGFIRTFAGELSIAEIKNTLPESMIPKAAVALFETMIRELNRESRETGRRG